MTNILNKLRELSNYYEVNRQAGHTFKMLNGVLNPTKYTTPYDAKTHTSSRGAIILTHNNDMARCINEQIKKLSNDKT